MTIYRLLTLAFPTMIVLIGYAIRYLFDFDTINFIGPTLSTSAISLLLPLLEPKKVIIKSGVNLPNGTQLSHKSDNIFIALNVIFIIIAVTAWYTCNMLTFTGTKLTVSAYIGVASYFLAVILTFIKRYLI